MSRIDSRVVEMAVGVSYKRSVITPTACSHLFECLYWRYIFFRFRVVSANKILQIILPKTAPLRKKGVVPLWEADITFECLFYNKPHGSRDTTQDLFSVCIQKIRKTKLYGTYPRSTLGLIVYDLV